MCCCRETSEAPRGTLTGFNESIHVHVYNFRCMTVHAHERILVSLCMFCTPSHRHAMHCRNVIFVPPFFSNAILSRVLVFNVLASCSKSSTDCSSLSSSGRI